MTGAACSLALHLALLLDASSSIYPQEWRLQVDATAAALTAPAALRSIESGAGVAVAAIGFTERQTVMVPWTVLRTGDDARAFAAALVSAPRPPGLFTDIAGAMDAALTAMDEAPCEPDRRVIDLSTDGKPSTGDTPVPHVRDRAQAAGVTVNAIGVGEDVPGWLRENAATEGGFVVESAGWEGYSQGILRKIKSELAAR